MSKLAHPIDSMCYAVPHGVDKAMCTNRKPTRRATKGRPVSGRSIIWQLRFAAPRYARAEGVQKQVVDYSRGHDGIA
jgi:hypothetical protein